VVIGPRVADFRDVVAAFVEGGGIRQVQAAELRATLSDLMASGDARAEVARRARAVIRAEQGGTARTAEVLLAMLSSRG
jgi:3-deoxy-D-manno-octulosonic-acid transferase